MTDEQITEPYPGVPPEKTADMDACVESVMGKQPELDKESAIKICYSSVVEGKDLDEVMKAFVLDAAPAAPETTEAEPVTEAATIKAKVRAAIRAVEELLDLKDIPGELRESVKSLREIFKTKAWADLASEVTGSEAAAESQPQERPISERFAEFSFIPASVVPPNQAFNTSV